MIVMLNFFSFILDLTPCIPYSITFAFPGLFYQKFLYLVLEVIRSTLISFYSI